jgi:hypothetical protein
MAVMRSDQLDRKKNLRLGLFLLAVFLVLYAGSVVFVLVSH